MMNRGYAGACLLALLALALSVTTVAAERSEVTELRQRLSALQTHPELGRLAAYEQVQAQRAVDAFNQSRPRDREAARYLAERRVEIAEISARTEAASNELSKLDATRSELRVEVSQRDAARARQEAEQLRIQAQIQAEEAERLRQEAAAEAVAREDVEQTLSRVTGRQTAQLSAARRKEAELARQEAELVADAKLPPSRFSGADEIFTLDGGAYSPGAAGLTPSGKSAVQALAAYLQIRRNTKVRIESYDADAALAQRRAQSLQTALTAAGVPANRMQAAGKAGATRAAQVTVSP